MAVEGTWRIEGADLDQDALATVRGLVAGEEHVRVELSPDGRTLFGRARAEQPTLNRMLRLAERIHRHVGGTLEVADDLGVLGKPFPCPSQGVDLTGTRRDRYASELAGRGLTELPDDALHGRPAHLDLSSNRFTHLPCLPDFVASVDLSNNRIEALPPGSLHGCPPKVDLSHNPCPHLPDDALASPTLLELVARRMGLEALPDVGGGALRHLDVSGNALVSLPASVSSLPLRHLDLFGNPLDELPAHLTRLKKLTWLSVAQTPLTDLPRLALPRLTELRLDRARFAAVPNTVARLRRLQCLDLSRLPLVDLPGFLADLPDLRTLRLVHTTLEGLPDALRGMARLESLDLRGTPIDEVPEWLADLGWLQSLDLSHTRVRDLPEALERSPVQRLDLGSLALTDVPEVVDVMPELTHVDLSGNQLREVPLSVLHHPRLRVLDVRDNPLARPVEAWDCKAGLRIVA